MPCTDRPSASGPPAAAAPTAQQVPVRQSPLRPAPARRGTRASPPTTPAPAASDARRPPATRTSSARPPPAPSALTWPCGAVTDGTDAQRARDLQLDPRRQPQAPDAVRAEQRRAAEVVLDRRARAQAAAALRARRRHHLLDAADHLRPRFLLRLPRARGVQRHLRPARAQQLVGLDRDRGGAAVVGDARQVDVAADALARDRVAHLDVDGCLGGVSGLSSTASVASGAAGRVRVSRAGRDPLPGQRVLQDRTARSRAAPRSTPPRPAAASPTVRRRPRSAAGRRRRRHGRQAAAHTASSSDRAAHRALP